MRVSIVSIVLAGGMLVLGACSTVQEPDAMAVTDARCRGRAEAIPTGRQTGDVRQDYRCRSVHASNYRPNSGRNVAIDRALSSGR
ncbi:hypothetical protein GGQ87_000522 [Brevundimonas alba]|uniref:Lipoprotein n=1 Tax=Brevundimonas alba TaxID=74314 RepID=A0A7X6BMV1_9CAUL|nr:hypothetical protein [Brevundimonas alba]NJC40264.1 hypothetical protein [Brevundimonas alba]